ncbi:MAG: hypothetical protein IJ614_06345 [Prevotella sp.]|nr:hypothetical protein [Prevotella sp.]
MKFLSMAALALTGIMMAGCTSDDDIINNPQQSENKDNVVTLTTTISMDGGTQTRALTSSGVKTFAVGETMAVIYKNASGNTVKAESLALTNVDIASGSKSAKFTFNLESPNNTKGVTYIYPAAMAKDDGTVNYDALSTQDGTLATLSSNLDLATKTAAWNGNSLPAATLDNLLAILAITLNNSEGTSEITSSITGMTISDGKNSYTVTRSAAAGPIYVAIQPTVSADIKISATTGSIIYTKSLASKDYVASNGYNLSWKMTQQEGALGGFFTVDSEGKKVCFSKGNLQATYNGTAWSWAFAANQWDYIGGDESGSDPQTGNNFINGDGAMSANGTVDLFGWSTSATTFGIHNSTTGSTYSGDFVDWGANIGTGWRTLTKDEWTYLFTNHTKGWSTIAGVGGYVIRPDGVSTAIEASYSDSEWAAQEAAGSVFLPAAGGRSGSVNAVTGSEGRYWSSSYPSADAAYYVKFTSGSLESSSSEESLNNFSRSNGCSVRLVRDL